MKKDLYCKHCDTILGFIEDGAFVFMCNKTAFIRVENKNQTAKCRKCSSLTTFSVDNKVLKTFGNDKLRSRLIIKEKSKQT